MENITEKFKPLTRMYQCYRRQTYDRRNCDDNSQT